jgi:hypothetical protein
VEDYSKQRCSSAHKGQAIQQLTGGTNRWVLRKRDSLGLILNLNYKKYAAVCFQFGVFDGYVRHNTCVCPQATQNEDQVLPTAAGAALLSSSCLSPLSVLQRFLHLLSRLQVPILTGTQASLFATVQLVALVVEIV